jgi:hypothetical protein
VRSRSASLVSGPSARSQPIIRASDPALKVARMPIAGGGRSPRAGGRIRIVGPKRPLSETVEAAELPPQPDDPRPAVFRNVPPFGGAA